MWSAIEAWYVADDQPRKLRTAPRQNQRSEVRGQNGFNSPEHVAANFKPNCSKLRCPSGHKKRKRQLRATVSELALPLSFAPIQRQRSVSLDRRLRKVKALPSAPHRLHRLSNKQWARRAGAFAAADTIRCRSRPGVERQGCTS